MSVIATLKFVECKPQGGALRNDGIFLPVWVVDVVEAKTSRLVTDSHHSDVLQHHDHPAL